MKLFKLSVVSLSIFLLSKRLFAQVGEQAPLAALENLIIRMGQLIAQLVPLVMGIGLLAFLWGLVRFIFNAGNPDSQAEGKRIMVWGIIALFFMASVWGIVGFLQETFGLKNSTPPPSVNVPVPGNPDTL